MLKFAASRHNWTVQNWRRFLFINKSPFTPFTHTSDKTIAIGLLCDSKAPPRKGSSSH